MAAAARLISSSTALQSKEREILAHHTKALAAVIADDVGDERDVQARVVATALMGVHIALVELARFRDPPADVVVFLRPASPQSSSLTIGT